MDYHFIACSGARTENILSVDASGPTNAWGKKGEPQYGELPQIDKGYLDENTTLVTFLVGGNDARFTDVIKKCLYESGPVLCPYSKLDGETETLDKTEPELIKGKVRQSIVTTLKAIAAKAPNAEIVLMGYPQLFEKNAGCLIPLLAAEEAQWLNETSALMGEQMKGAALDAQNAGVKATFADPISAFHGKAICGEPETVHGIVNDKTPGDDPGSLVSGQSFHPKTEGATIYANVLNATLRSLGV
ncbi:SGNH/GDSL hydrolase family protein [Streptomyces inhibens]|uniref:SGNH/GDSL hydrolase family protein n=1 Tax=Streptomyces inhibens TaxID=2293571 RepID=UPI003799B9E3